jgi:DNA polymerase-3 subunit epsilon
MAHNADFDINFIYDNYHRHFGGILSNDYIDTLRMAREVLPNLSRHKLENLARKFKIEQEQAHRALDDCKTTHLVYQKMKELLDDMDGEGNENSE